MAILTAGELEQFRRTMARQFPPSWTKPQVNAALQAIEDRLRSATTETTLSTDIETVAPGIFTPAQKRRLFGVWCVMAASRLGVI